MLSEVFLSWHILGFSSYIQGEAALSWQVLVSFRVYRMRLPSSDIFLFLTLCTGWGCFVLTSSSFFPSKQNEAAFVLTSSSFFPSVQNEAACPWHVLVFYLTHRMKLPRLDMFLFLTVLRVRSSCSDLCLSVLVFRVRSSYPDEKGYVDQRQKELHDLWKGLKVGQVVWRPGMLSVYCAVLAEQFLP